MRVNDSDLELSVADCALVRGALMQHSNELAKQAKALRDKLQHPEMAAELEREAERVVDTILPAFAEQRSLAFG